MQLLRNCTNSSARSVLSTKPGVVQKPNVGRKIPLPTLALRSEIRRPLPSQRRLLDGSRENDAMAERERIVTEAGMGIGLTHVGVQWLVGIGIFLFCMTASVFLISALSTLREVSFAARRVTVVMKLLELEMPETMAAMRLSSLEISDCIEEFTALGSDLASGLRSSANVVSAAEKGMHEGTEMFKHTILPAIRSKTPDAKNALEAMLRERATMQETSILAMDLAERPSRQLRALRQGVSSLKLGVKAAALWKALRRSPQSQSITDTPINDKNDIHHPSSNT